MNWAGSNTTWQKHTGWLELSSTTTGGTALLSVLFRVTAFASLAPYEFSESGVLLSGEISMSCNDCPSKDRKKYEKCYQRILMNKYIIKLTKMFQPFPSCGVAECFGLVLSCTSSSLLLFQYLSEALFVLLLDFSISLLPDLELDLLSRPKQYKSIFLKLTGLVDGVSCVHFKRNSGEIIDTYEV